MIGLDRWVTYKPSARLLVASVVLSVTTFAVYLRYFDILAPFIPDGSVRANSGLFFGVPVFVLLGGQTLLAVWFTHSSITLAAPEKRDALKAYFVVSFEILMFSFYYVIFPYYGPYTFIVYFMPSEAFSRFAYPVLVAWTLTIVLGTYLLMQRTFRIQNTPRLGTARKLLLVAGVLAVILVTAS